MKYGIKHDNGVIISLTRFANDTVPGTHVELTEAQYLQFNTELRQNPFSTFDENNTTLIKDSAKLAATVTKRNKDKMRINLMAMSNELDLMVRLQEDTTALQAVFDALAVDYRS